MKTPVNSIRTRFGMAALVGLFLQIPGCWCEPVEPEQFNAFPSPLEGGSSAFCGSLAPAQCEYLARCAPAEHAGLEATQGGCQQASAQQCERDNAGYQAAEAAGRARFDGVLARGCVDGVRARGCGEDAPPACAEVFGGSVQQGGQCDEDLECAAGLFCSGGPLTCGVCVGKFGPDGPCWSDSSCQAGLACKEDRCTRPLALGSGCAEDPTACPSGSICFPPFVEFAVCTALANPGATCSQFSPCKAGLACVAQDAGSSCVGPVASGAACDPQGRTAPVCDGEGVRFFCNPTTRLCEELTVAAADGDCGTGVVCPSHQRCTAGVCQDRPTVGEACQVSSGVDPCFLSRCVRGLCVQNARAGEPCDAGCAGLACVDGRCGKTPCDGGEAWDAWVPPPDAAVPDDAGGVAP